MHAITSLILAKKNLITIFFLFTFKMFSKQIIWYLSLISKADNHTSLTKNMNRNCFCKNFVYMNKHCRQLQWLYAKLKTLNKGFETTLLLPNFKRERWKEREMEKKKESIYSHVNEYIVDHVFFVVLFSFWPHGCSSLCLSDVYIPVHCIPGPSLMHYIPITRLLISRVRNRQVLVRNISPLKLKLHPQCTSSK